MTYQLIVGEDPKLGVIVKREILRYKRGAHGSPFHFLDFANGEGFAITNEEAFDKLDADLTREAQKLDSPDTLAIKGLGQFSRFKAASAFRQLIENWHVSDFHIASARGDKEDEDAEHLSASGDNLPAMARFLYEKHPAVFDDIRRKMQERVPGVTDIKVTVTEDGRLLMRYQAAADPLCGRAGEPTLPRTDGNAGGGVSPVRGTWRAGLCVVAFSRFSERSTSRKHLLAGERTGRNHRLPSCKLSAVQAPHSGRRPTRIFVETGSI